MSLVYTCSNLPGNVHWAQPLFFLPHFLLSLQHNLWRRKKRQAGGDFRFISRIVLLNESVNYTDSTIRIADTDGAETGL